MPFDSNGNYSLPSGYLAENGQTIQPSQHNSPLEDIAAGLSGSLLRSGVAPMSGQLKLADGTVALPGLAFNTGTGTGLYRSTAGFAVAIGGVKVAEFSAAGLILGGAPVGMVSPYAGATAPSGWMLCYGQSLVRASYPALYAAIGVVYGTVDSTHFNVPDLRGLIVAGKDDMGGTAATRLTSTTISPDAITLNAAGGLQTHTLTSAQMPSHTHTATVTESPHTHSNVLNDTSTLPSVGTQAGPPSLGSPGSTASASTGLTVSNSSTGSGAAHNNVQPTKILNYIIFAGI